MAEAPLAWLVVGRVFELALSTRPEDRARALIPTPPMLPILRPSLTLCIVCALLSARGGADQKVGAWPHRRSRVECYDLPHCGRDAEVAGQ